MRRGAAIVVLALLAAVSCTQTNHNPFIVRVTSLNGGVPLFADVVAIDPVDSTTFVPNDLTPVEFTNRPYSASVVDPGNFSLDCNIYRYTVTWRATTGTPPLNLAAYTHTEATAFSVPFNSITEAAVTVVQIGMKSSPPFADLAVSGGQIPLIADIVFIGASESDPDDEIEIHASMSVVFADFVDQE